jgi:hypothetical protein
VNGRTVRREDGAEGGGGGNTAYEPYYQKKEEEKDQQQIDAFLQMSSTIQFITAKAYICLITIYIKISLAISSAMSFVDTG